MRIIGSNSAALFGEMETLAASLGHLVRPGLYQEQAMVHEDHDGRQPQNLKNELRNQMSAPGLLPLPPHTRCLVKHVSPGMVADSNPCAQLDCLYFVGEGLKLAQLLSEQTQGLDCQS